MLVCTVETIAVGCNSDCTGHRRRYLSYGMEYRIFVRELYVLRVHRRRRRRIFVQELYVLRVHRRRRRAIDLLRLVADPDLRAGCKQQGILTKSTPLLPDTTAFNDKPVTLTEVLLSTMAQLASPTKRRKCRGVGVQPRRPKRRCMSNGRRGRTREKS